MKFTSLKEIEHKYSGNVDEVALIKKYNKTLKEEGLNWINILRRQAKIEAKEGQYSNAMLCTGAYTQFMAFFNINEADLEVNK